MYKRARRTRCRSLRTTTCSSISRRQLPIQRSAVPFCHGLRYEVRLGSLPSALPNSTTAGLKIESRSKMRYRGGVVVRKRFTQMLDEPGRRRMEGGVEVNDMTTAVLDDEEAIQQPKRSGRHREQVHRGDVRPCGCARTQPNASPRRAQPSAAACIATVFSDTMNPSFVSSAWIRGAPQPSCAMCRMSRRISAARRGRPGKRVLEMRVQYRRKRLRFHSATVSALTMTRRLAHAGHDSRSATQKSRSTSSRSGRGRAFLSAVTCCRRTRFSITRSARRRLIARITRGAERDEENESAQHGGSLAFFGPKLKHGERSASL